MELLDGQDALVGASRAALARIGRLDAGELGSVSADGGDELGSLSLALRGKLRKRAHGAHDVLLALRLCARCRAADASVRLATASEVKDTVVEPVVPTV